MRWSLLALLLLFPQVDHGTQGRSHGESGVGTASVFSNPVAWYKFNDPSDLGKSETLGALALTPANTPTATGGATGYSAHFNESSSQYAKNDTPSWGGTLTGKDFMWCGWYRQGEDDDNATVAGQYTTNLHWLVYRLSGDGNLVGVVYDDDLDNVVTSIAAATAGPLVTKRNQTCLYWDVSTKTAYLDINNGTASSSNTDADVDDFSDTPSPFTINKFSSGNYSDDLDMSTNAFWVATELDFATIKTGFYNSGKGMTCGELTTAERVNLVSCWDMDEDGGPYADSIGSNTLTGVNTPTQAAALVGQPESGMSGHFVDAENQYMSSTSSVFEISTGQKKSACLWFNNESAANDSDVLRENGNYIWRLEATGDGQELKLYAYENASYEGVAKSPAQYSVNAWQHACFTYDGSSLTVYLNGAAGTPLTGFAFEPQAGQVFTVTGSGNYDGVIDQVLFWNYDIGQEGVNEVYAAGEGKFY